MAFMIHIIKVIFCSKLVIVCNIFTCNNDTYLNLFIYPSHFRFLPVVMGHGH